MSLNSYEAVEVGANNTGERVDTEEAKGRAFSASIEQQPQKDSIPEEDFS